jgi:endonuclease YncB( thermonuclease family)
MGWPDRLQRAAMHVTVLSFAMLVSMATQAANITGVPRIVDGDTLAISTTKVRLEGIDAPETDQFCLNATGVRWTCGIEARDQLIAHVAGREVSCTSSGIDAYKRTLATCRLAGEDLNGWMVQEGWALAYVKYSSKYVRDEDDAQTHQRGLWLRRGTGDTATPRQLFSALTAFR